MTGLARGVQDMEKRTDKLIARRVGIEYKYSNRQGTRAGDFWPQGAKMLESCEVSNLLYTVPPTTSAVDAGSRETRAGSGYRSIFRLISMGLNLWAPGIIWVGLIISCRAV
jgi:hypothetical protein